MIIFNLKGLLVAIVTAIVFVIFVLLKWFVLAFLISGTVGFWLSMKLSVKGEGFFKRPSIFFIPTHVYSALIILFGILAGIFNDRITFNEETDYTTVDYRSILFEDDINSLNLTSLNGDDSIALELKMYVASSVSKFMKPEDFNYLVKLNEDNNSALILIEMEEIDDLKESLKSDVTGISHDFTFSNENFFGKTLYIGQFENDKLMKSITPSGIESGRFFTNRSDFYDFYGVIADSILIN